jgi:S-DNA-T family DNA segregation ATPase FtsK/SpoIIIE
MPKSENHKFKSLLVAQVLLKRTDEDHAVKTSDIIEHLKNYGITAEAHSVQRDIRALNELFEKDNNDDDFLSIYLGVGKVKATRVIEINQKEYIDNGDELSLEPEKVKNRFEYINDAPIVAEVGKSSSIGVVGDYNALCDTIINMSMDMAIRHYYKEVKMYYLFPGEEADKFSWLRWLRHVYNEDLKIKNIVMDEESSNTTLDYLYSKLSQRKNMPLTPGEKYDVHHVVFVFGVQIMDIVKCTTFPELYVIEYIQRLINAGK